MDLLTFIVELVRSLAWPVAALVVAILFRTELRALLHRVRKGKVGPAEFEFEATIAALRDRVRPPETPPVKPEPGLLNRASEDPRSVILYAWLRVQAVVEDVVAKHATPEDRMARGSITLRVLHRLLREKSEYIDIYNDLRMLRSQAVHEIDFSPRPSSVVEFVDLANELVAVLEPYARE